VNGHEILLAALRWSAAYENRRAIGAEKRRHEKALKAYDPAVSRALFTPAEREYSRIRSAAYDAGNRLTPARRKEQAAMRALARVCTTVRSQQRVEDAAEVIEVDVKLLTR
jgi:hypothetical protein